MNAKREACEGMGQTLAPAPARAVLQPKQATSYKQASNMEEEKGDQDKARLREIAG